ncbi:MAG: lipoprotein-releasing system permease protein [Planctomycetota bacterium]|jgi:lipoprotein-releasing system permease protein
MYRSFLSWRYLTSRRTNLIGIGGIFVAVTALILILSIMTGFLNEARSSIRGSLSDLLIQPIQLNRDNRDGRVVPDAPERILEVIRADPRVEGAAAHLSWGGILTQEGSQSERAEAFMASSQMSDLPLVKIVGINVEDEFSTTSFRLSLTREPTVDKSGFPRGKRVENPDAPFDLPPEFRSKIAKKPPVVLVGEQLYYRLGLRRGESVQITTIVPSAMTNGAPSNPPNMSFVVGGTFRSGENEMDLDRVYVLRDSLQDLIGDAREFSEILVRLKDYDRDGTAVRDDLRHSLALMALVRGYTSEVKTWEEFRASLLGAIHNERTLMAIMLSLVLVVAGFCIFAILSMMVTEKRRDIGILTAIGATPRGILTTFLMVAFWDALIGTVLGATAGVWAAYKIDPIERWISDALGVQVFNREVYLFDHIPAHVDPMAVTLIVSGTFLCTLLFAALPAWSAARTDPIEALRYE